MKQKVFALQSDLIKHLQTDPRTAHGIVDKIKVGVFSSVTAAAAAITTGTFTTIIVDTTTLVIDSANHRVGVLNASPSYALDVTGDFRVSGKFGCNSKNPQGAYSLGSAAPAGGTGTAAGGYDTAVDRNSAITLLNAIRSCLIAAGIATS